MRRHQGQVRLTLGRGRGARRLRLDEAADVLADLDVLERPLTWDDDIDRIHASRLGLGWTGVCKLTKSVVLT